jgi:hypothetical protein
VTAQDARCGICGGAHDAYSALCPPDEVLDVPYVTGDPGVIVTAYVTCPECGEGFLAMADEKVTGCAQH